MCCERKIVQPELQQNVHTEKLSLTMQYPLTETYVRLTF